MTVVLVATGVGAIVAGMIGGALGAAANGGNIIKSALYGAFSGAAAQIGIAASAIWGGMQAEIQGGSFGHGFLAAGIGALGGSDGGPGWGGFIRSAVIGGVATEITGGKFKNGAASAAFMYAVSAGVNRIATGGKNIEEVDGSGGAGSDNFNKNNELADNITIDDNGNVTFDASVSAEVGQEKQRDVLITRSHLKNAF